MSQYTYGGSELDLFAQATHWKDYWRRQLQPFVRGRVLDVGAGSGNNSFLLDALEFTRWSSLEPDRRLAEQLARTLASHRRAEVVVGTLATLTADRLFDTVLYLDVLEHIEDDGAELRAAVRHLEPGGRLIVIGPAHQWLYSPFDASIGHVRRYNRQSLCAAAPRDLSLVLVRYLDSAGLLASAGNRVLLRQAMPTIGQVRFWDRCLVPSSRVLDPLFGYRLGKSILGVWRRRAL